MLANDFLEAVGYDFGVEFSGALQKGDGSCAVQVAYPISSFWEEDV
jgi:hypothetical protein